MIGLLKGLFTLLRDTSDGAPVGFDFESAYQAILRDGTEEEKTAIQAAVLSAYSLIDDTIEAYTSSEGSPYPVNGYMVQEFVSAFCGAHGQPGAENRAFGAALE